MKEDNRSPKDFFLIIISVLIPTAVFVAFLLITNLFLLLTMILAVIAAIYLFNRVDSVKTPISRAFDHNRMFAFASILVIIILLPVILRSSPYWIFILTLAILWIVVALGINIQFGSAGIINLGAAAFYGVGAYTAGMLSTKLGMPPLFNLLFGAMMTMIVGALLFIPVLKTSSYFLSTFQGHFPFLRRAAHKDSNFHYEITSIKQTA